MTVTRDRFKMFSFSVMQSMFCIRLVVGTARIFTLEKQNVDCVDCIFSTSHLYFSSRLN